VIDKGFIIKKGNIAKEDERPETKADIILMEEMPEYDDHLQKNDSMQIYCLIP
jgi:hypothetical protein